MNSPVNRIGGDYSISVQCDPKRDVSPTLAQNIDMRIKSLQDQVARLERVKLLLQEPGGLLNVPIDDLRFAMSW